MAQPLVSVVVPVFRDAHRLRGCLEALSGQTIDRTTFEIVVVDNGENGSLGWAQTEFGARLANEVEPGSYAARNAGLKAALGEIVAFTDSDCRPASDWLEKGVGYFGPDGANSDLVTGRVQVVPQDSSAPSVAELWEMHNDFPGDYFVKEMGFGPTANLLVRRQVLDDLGGFDQRLKSGGDRDFGNRATAAGFSLIYADDVVVRHAARKSLRAVVRKMYRAISGRRDQLELQGRSRVVLLGGLPRQLVPPAREVVQGLRTDLPPGIRWKYVLGILAVHYARPFLTLFVVIGAPSTR